MFKRPKFLNDWLYAYWGWRTRPKNLFCERGDIEDKWYTFTYSPLCRTYYRQGWYRNRLGKWVAIKQ